MKLTLIALFLAVALGFAAAWSTPRTGAFGHRPAAAEPGNVAPATEVARIQARLKQVERRLRSRDVSHLNAAQRTARAAALDALRDYRERGIFPHNHDFPGRRVPYFVDKHGRLCALAYLMARSGRSDLVARIAATSNNVSVLELANDAELGAWLERNGLALEEAASIQLAYNGWGPGLSEADDGPNPGYAVASALARGLIGAYCPARHTTPTAPARP